MFKKHWRLCSEREKRPAGCRCGTRMRCSAATAAGAPAGGAFGGGQRDGRRADTAQKLSSASISSYTPIDSNKNTHESIGALSHIFTPISSS